MIPYLCMAEKACSCTVTGTGCANGRDTSDARPARISRQPFPSYFSTRDKEKSPLLRWAFADASMAQRGIHDDMEIAILPIDHARQRVCLAGRACTANRSG